MKFKRFIFGAAIVVAAVGGWAQTLTIHGLADYSTHALMQAFQKYGENDDMTHTKPMAGMNSADGKSVVDLNVKAADMEYNLGIKLDLGAGAMAKYNDFTDGYAKTPFYQGNVRVGFFNSQLYLFTGKWENLTNDYFQTGYVFDDQVISYFASAGVGQFLTGLDFTPHFASGLKIMAALPILPIGGNGMQGDPFNQWRILIKKIMLAAGYAIPDTDVMISLGWRPGTYYTGVQGYSTAGSATFDTDDGAFTKSAFGEAFIAAKLGGLVDGLDMNAALDVRYRPDATYTKTDGTTEEKSAVAIGFSYGADISMIEALPLQAELRFWFAGDDYIQSDEKLVGGILGVNGQHKIEGTNWEFGFGVRGSLFADALGTAFNNGEWLDPDDDPSDIVGVNRQTNAVSSPYFDGVEWTQMASVGVVGAKKSTTYFSIYGNPYMQYNLSNGYIRMGLEFEYCLARNEDDKAFGIGYRIPVGIVFNF